MKVEITIDETCPETNVKITASHYTPELEELKANLLAHATNKLVGFMDKEARLFDWSEIIRVYTEGNKIYCSTIKGNYQTRLTMRELENILPARQFIKISRSEIVNLDYVVRLDLSFAGTIALEMRNKSVSYVARRHLKEFKKALGM